MSSRVWHVIVNKVAKMHAWLASAEKISCGSMFPADTNHAFLCTFCVLYYALNSCIEKPIKLTHSQ